MPSSEKLSDESVHVMLSEALQRNAKHEARLSNISDLAREPVKLQRPFAPLGMTTALRVLELRISLLFGALGLTISRSICGGLSQPLILLPL